MNENAFSGTELGIALTEQELEDVVGGDGYLARKLGYVIGLFAAMVVQTATSPEMQPYCFGA
jgi:hypothetical protein